MEESTIDMYDVTESECVTDYCCDRCGATDRPRMLQVEGRTGVIMICYEGCIQAFKADFDQLLIPEYDPE